MKSGIKSRIRVAVIIASTFALCTELHADGLRERVLRDAAKKAGLVPVEKTHAEVDPKSAAAGKLIFQTTKLSLDRQTACATCHLDKFGSADGLPNAIGIEGTGEGMARLKSGGEIIPRNTLPFWGVGGVGYNVFFCDGKVGRTSGPIESQFGAQPPSNDPLVVAVHIPPAEIGEMISNSKQNERLKVESIATADEVYLRLLRQLLEDDVIKTALVYAASKQAGDLQFLDVAQALAAFIRDNFKLRNTRFHDFVFSEGHLDDQEVAGGLIFYGKGRCVTCHNGAYFSDMKFHAVPFPEVGFGKNGFGVDYGRYNVTLEPADRYKFRTPPLYNVAKTSPYSHSGSVVDLAQAIRVHIDPLSAYDPSKMSSAQRAEFYQQLKAWTREPLDALVLDDADIIALVSFLKTLEFDSGSPVQVTD